MSNIPVLIRLLFGLIVCYVPPLYALDAQTHLQNHLQGLGSFTADFSQRIIDIDRTKVEPSTGSMSFKRPGKFIWSYQEPYEQEIISNGEQLWIYDKDLEQVTVRPVGDQFTQTPINILDDPATIIKQYEVELLSERGSEVEIQLTPHNKELGFNYVILIFNHTGLIGMEIYDAFDHYNSLSFVNIDLQASLNDNIFAFETPQGVDVIHASE
ncbi:MAG: outer membrane lipoprotein chaperone LolA [Gammaproteobacteria bacterium]|nr:outer membrane lipoprotein chaperone LolA [Gammaproteobacteria bacterium]